MRLLPVASCVFALALGAAACNEAPETTADPIDTNGAAATTPTGTSGVSGDEADRAEVAQQDTDAFRDDLPATASPLPIIGALGILSLAAAAGLRRIRR
jgi:hypothetical protein